jgi:hypothetical protein
MSNQLLPIVHLLHIDNDKHVAQMKNHICCKFVLFKCLLLLFITVFTKCLRVIHRLVQMDDDNKTANNLDDTVANGGNMKTCYEQIRHCVRTSIASSNGRHSLLYILLHTQPSMLQQSNAVDM